MSADAEKPSMVRSLEATREVELLSWGGTDDRGSVEWQSKDEDGVAHRNCRRWAVVGGMELGHHIIETELEISLAAFDLWQERMRDSALEFQAAIRKAERERAPKRRR